MKLEKQILANREKNTSGITLVALVVTIVVLLILAGITITYVMGDNSIFKKASDAKIQTEIAKIEERASLIYADKLLEKAETNFDNKPTMQEIVGQLREEGYKIEQVALSGSEITGISLDKESITLGFGRTNTLQVTLEGSNEPYTYYVKIDGKYYQMHFNGGAVKIDRTESDISGSGDITAQTITVSSGDETIATATVDNTTNVVTVTAKDTAGTVAITVTYGNYTKTCNVTVEKMELELNSVRARIATGYTRWLTAIVKPETASQEFEWTSSNTEIATVDNKGVITAKKKGTTTITVKTTDGSNLSKICEVTVEDGIDVTTLTSIQTENKIARDNNGNLIIVPGGFKVLTSEGTKVTDGVVIQDEEGNEFVWIPVDSVSKGANERADDIRLGRYTFDANNGTPKKEQDADNYMEVVNVNGNIGSYYQELTSDSSNLAAKNLGDFVNKTNTNGGFYFGRYEASQGSDGKTKTQYDKPVWRNISQSNAATAAREMYDSSCVESDLINSYSWDTVIVFIQKYSGNANFANKSSVNAQVLNTGKSEEIACNIYDMASNCIEWTTEHSRGAANPCVNRDGYYSYINGLGGYLPSLRFMTTVNDKQTYITFRPILYLK